MLKKIIKSGLIVLIGILLGRITGFFRESIIAARFGVSHQADLLILILTIPDFLLNILVGGAMGAALIPEFKRLKYLTSQLFIQVSVISFLFFSVITLMFCFQTDLLVQIFAPGLENSGSGMVENLLRISLWTIPLTALASATVAYLQTNEHFTVPALSTVFYNSVLLVALYFSDGKDLYPIALAVVVGATIRYGTHVIDAILLGCKQFKYRWKFWIVKKSLIIRYFQAILSAGILLFLPLIARNIASFEGTGSIASLNYANKLIELPLGTFITAISVALFPSLATLFSKDDSSNEAIVLSKHSLSIVFIVSTAFAINFFFFNGIYTRLIFGWGVMTLKQIKVIVWLSAILALSLPAQGLISITQMVLNSKKDMKMPFYVSFVALILFYPAAKILTSQIGLNGIAISLVLIFYFVLIGHLVILKAKHGINFFKPIFSLENATVSLISLGIFIPFFGLKQLFDNIWIQLLISGISLVTMMSVSIFLNKTYREYILIKISRYFRKVY